MGEWCFGTTDNVRVSFRKEDRDYGILGLMLLALVNPDASLFFPHIFFEVDTESCRRRRFNYSGSVFYEDDWIESAGTMGIGDGDEGAAASFRIYNFTPVDTSIVNCFDPRSRHPILVPLRCCGAELESYVHTEEEDPSVCLGYSFENNPDPVTVLSLCIKGTGIDLVTPCAEDTDPYDVAAADALEMVFDCVDAVYVPKWFLRLGDPEIMKAVKVIQKWWKHSIYWNPRHPVCMKRANEQYDIYKEGPSD